MPTVYTYQFFMNTSNYNDYRSIFAPASYLASQMPRLLDQGGMAGYIYVHPNAIRGQLYAPDEFSTPEKMKDMLDDVLDRMARMPGMTQRLLFKYPPGKRRFGRVFGGHSSEMAPIPGISATNLGYPMGKVPREPWNPGLQESPRGSFDDVFGGDRIPSSFDTAYSNARRPTRPHEPGKGMRVPRGIQNMDSRLFGVKELTSPNLAESLRRSMPFNLPDGQIRFHLVAGPKVWAQGQDTSVNPAWRKAYAHVLVTGGGVPSAQALRDISPKSGAYVNEVSFVYHFIMGFLSFNFSRRGYTIQIGNTTFGVSIMASYQRSRSDGILIWFSM